MKLALVYPPFYAKPFNENLATVDDEFGLFPHIGFGWVAQGAKAAGWDVRLWDAPATRKSCDDVAEEVAAWSPDLVGYSGHAAQTIRDMLAWSKPLHDRLGIPQIVGGYEAKAYPHELMEHGCFDFLVGGEGHLVLPEFLRAFERGRGYESVPDLFFRKGGELEHTFRGPRVPFSEFPIPDRSIFPNHLYYSHISQRRSFTIGMSEVGCPYPCTFCCMRHSGWDSRSVEQVIEEMEQCVALGIREIDWFDPLMLRDRERAIGIAREVKHRNLDIIWSCRSRVDSLSGAKSHGKPDEELIEALAEGGCRRIYFGVEAGDDEVLKQMQKGQKAAAPLRKTLAAVEEAGIMSLGFFIVGAPGDTRETVRKTIDFSLSLPVSYAQYQIAIIKPHTELERRHVVEELGIDYWREYVAGRAPEMLLPTPWTDMDRAELEALAREAYLRFYTRPGYVLKMLRRIESREELMRYARVFTQLFLRPNRPKDEGKLADTSARIRRSTRALAEALLSVANPGARHAVFQRGGGIRGALRLALEELQREPEPMLTRENAKELGARPPQPDSFAGKYVPWFDRDLEKKPRRLNVIAPGE